MNTENKTVQDLEFELEKAVNLWVDRSFNFIQLPVVEKWAESCGSSLIEYIRSLNPDDLFEDWLHEMNFSKLVSEWSVNSEHEQIIVCSSREDFINSYGQEDWDEFKSYCMEIYVDDIEDYGYQQENYPLWNTLFEFRDSSRNNEEDIQKCMSVGLGVIENLDSFNTIIFMTSAGHSFFSAYWIPLYLEFFPDEKTKYEGIDYSHL